MLNNVIRLYVLMPRSSQPSPRRHRGSLRDARKVGFTIEGASDDRCAALAAELGTTKSFLVQWLLDNSELTPQGLVVRKDAVLARKNLEELPIKTA